MNIAAYCRVSTDKEDQLNSLETQKAFFIEYAERNKHNLVGLYADEGITGTKTKNRKKFNQLMSDSEQGLFELVVVKDISRLARNTVDLLQSVRKLRALNIEMLFLTSNMTTLGNSEFILTIFGALAQEESASTSKRIKFSKQISAEKGRVPNVVFGYNKTKGDYYNLEINEEEAAVVRQMFQWYTEDKYGTLVIARMLNSQGILTKRGNQWAQTTVCFVLKNPLYIGQVVNGREEIKDFLTGVRVKHDEEDWYIVENKKLQIVDTDMFNNAQEILKGRYDSFKMNNERYSNKYLFSTLIKCKECGWSFRRTTRTYKNTYVKWTCSGRNTNGVNSCNNAISIKEEELIKAIQDYFVVVVSSKEDITQKTINNYEQTIQETSQHAQENVEIENKIERLRTTRQKYMDMFVDDIITRPELNEKLEGTRNEISQLEMKLRQNSAQPITSEEIRQMMSDMFKKVEDMVDVSALSNAQIKEIIEKIEVDKEGNVDISLKKIKGMLSIPSV